MKSFSLKARDGVFLAGHIHNSSKEERGVVLTQPATAVKTRYYYSFAQFLNDHGYHVITFNYRGFCESRPKDLDLAKVDYSYSDFGLKDIPAMVDFAKEEFSHLPLIGIGHSVGAQMIGLMDNYQKYDGFIGIGSSAGYPPNMPLDFRLQANFFFKIFGPILLKIFGYIPVKKLGIMEDLPKKVFQVWKDWCLDPEFLYSDRFMGNTIPRGDYQNFSFPIHVFHSLDDEIASTKNVDLFWGRVKSHKGLSITPISPKELKINKIKHFGYFRKNLKETFWPMVLEKLNEFTQEK